MEKIKQPVLVLVGPTAIGKTALSLQLARQFSCEVVSMDSMQVYRHMDIGTAKISKEEQGEVPHHLLDIVEPDEHYDASMYCRDALRTITEIHARGHIPLVTGGTGLYLQSLTKGFFEGPPSDSAVRERLQEELDNLGPEEMHARLEQLDPLSAQRLHPNDSYRVMRALEIFAITGKPWSQLLSQHKPENQFANMLQIGLTCDRPLLYDRINMRTQIMLDAGLEEEVRGLLDMGYSRELRSMGSIGYKHMANFIFGDWEFEEMKTLLARDTRRYAKRQYTWFNKDEDLHWYQKESKAEIVDRVGQWLEDQLSKNL
ncbi:tRNA (adenosine(37)-N6)-dimethylallyltransferase MiaA [Desulfotalea psychrophila]|uniref:tRNA dimethylallyltransferase n=1 Tax=Desulfotalea psychrophila (strain LSv54 / DSM 12343) TaxID=177439 RepID=MIAA_DESPS|nr:tRNA (adenosine(37)-N6)-dimethylallyltransferase MiaA [Desulfotalea psychrophila]Q6ALW6.1 RecName: Full=tRNA dimethylallyltransferase; AltName: Full=Dimethylallyl diphosphate:tRNA dimethylallyltransferase; Short=DMAPP:tRNA dimethylallyltransferase; Short=DMATase; AltName: Full=Isopentenyl-diphosphate:tRNA isopentenyltransferase; Short=IPP transferase; Short=IPPT; Short=IPTase [Desulfotalea psychrophila LSv54]CAG36659.1 probable tRNA delta-2-isopentenylpyrophosphate transferase (TrpX) [Desulfot